MEVLYHILTTVNTPDDNHLVVQSSRILCICIIFYSINLSLLRGFHCNLAQPLKYQQIDRIESHSYMNVDVELIFTDIKYKKTISLFLETKRVFLIFTAEILKQVLNS